MERAGAQGQHWVSSGQGERSRRRPCRRCRRHQLEGGKPGNTAAAGDGSSPGAASLASASPGSAAPSASSSLGRRRFTSAASEAPALSSASRGGGGGGGCPHKPSAPPSRRCQAPAIAPCGAPEPGRAAAHMEK
ncbi:uncharacterized protein LOC143820625 isoform X2 [Paroedura picta]|uniref:uncharacterized protein LOC143820625 isoform X2 n=1 Tax=Paroedura picta TaxID=143630 RepID=UPI0040575039